MEEIEIYNTVEALFIRAIENWLQHPEERGVAMHPDFPNDYILFMHGLAREMSRTLPLEIAAVEELRQRRFNIGFITILDDFIRIVEDLC